MILVFACGLAYEAGCALWVHYVERERIVTAMFWSAFNWVVTVVGVGASLSNPRPIAAGAAGYATGTACGILAKRALGRSSRVLAVAHEVVDGCLGALLPLWARTVCAWALALEWCLRCRQRPPNSPG